eukprot:5960200-Pyramimonas_sp.AAC.1
MLSCWCRGPRTPWLSEANVSSQADQTSGGKGLPSRMQPKSAIRGSLGSKRFVPFGSKTQGISEKTLMAC